MANYRSGVAGAPRAHLTNPLALHEGAGCYHYSYPYSVSDDYNWIMVGRADWTDSQYQYLFNFASTPLPPGHPIGRRVYMLFNEPDRSNTTPQQVVSKADWLMKELRARDANCLFIGFNISDTPNVSWTPYPGNPYSGGDPNEKLRLSKRYMWDVLAWWNDYYDHLAAGPCLLWRPTFHIYGYADEPAAAAGEINGGCQMWKDFWGLHGPQFASILPEYQDRPIITEFSSHPLQFRNSTWYNAFFNELYNWFASTGVQPPVPIAGWAWFLCHLGEQWLTYLHSIEIEPAGAQYKLYADRWG